MPGKKLKVYCETSFWSFLNGRPTPVQHVAVKQSATLKWWQEIAPLCEVYVSQHVNLESDGGDPEYAARRRKGFEGALRIDGMTPEIKELAATHPQCARDSADRTDGRVAYSDRNGLWHGCRSDVELQAHGESSRLAEDRLDDFQGRL